MRRVTLLLLLGSACTGDSSPAGGDTMGSTDTGAGTTRADDGAGTTTTNGSSGPVFTTTAADSSSSGGFDDTAGAPQVVFTLGDQFDFQFEDIGMLDINTFELLNVGSATATNMGPATPLVPPFSFNSGNMYPGQNGDCSDTLDPGDMCTVIIQFTPAVLAVVMEDLSVSYDGGQATITLIAEGRGTTDNLIEDGGFEACASSQAPTGWDQTPGAHWACSGSVGMVDPHGGSSMASVFDSSGAPFEMTYTIDLSAQTSIAGGMVTSSLSLWTYAPGGDDFEVDLTWRDQGGSELGSFTSGTLPATDWTETTDDEAVPTDAATAELTVRCVPAASTCSLHVDDVTFVLTR